MTTVVGLERRPDESLRQSAVGLGLAALIVGGWLALHTYGVFFHHWTLAGFLLVPLLVAVQCWLSVGLFIVAHDGMHGSLAPGLRGLNRTIGWLCLTIYAGFSYDRLRTSHYAHHRHPGTPLDPDFCADDPEHFWRWYAVFFRRYFGWQPLITIAAVVTVYWGLLGADLANLLVLWALPALLSSMQLFYFGTYLPHRHENAVFADIHNARSSGYPWLLSLLTCFHFGHHHEHHLAPQVPWWKLPGVNRS